MRQIGHEGVHVLWSEIQTNKQTNKGYFYTSLGTQLCPEIKFSLEESKPFQLRT